MRVITQPTVTLVGHTVFVEHPEYKIPPDGTDAEQLGAFSAKGCYASFGEEGRSNDENQRQVVAQKHGSVLEHCSASLFIEGISRAISLEIVRHRAGFSYSQLSTRYVKSEDAAIVLDPYYASIHDQPLTERGEHRVTEALLLQKFVDESQRAVVTYGHQVEWLMMLNPYGYTGFALRKWARGKARNILPHALETKMTITANHRSWRHFVGLRSHESAEDEIRRLAGAIYDVVLPLAPSHFDDVDIRLVRGLREITFRSEKV